MVAWAEDEEKTLHSQKAKNFTQVCKAESLQPWGNIADVRLHSHSKGSERLLEQLVAKYGAVITLMKQLDPDQLVGEYRKGDIIAECSDQDTPFDYPVVIIGYDTHNWIARTAFGPTFGDNGNFFLKKGTKNCQTGLAIGVAECTREEADQSTPAEDENTEDVDAEDENAEV